MTRGDLQRKLVTAAVELAEAVDAEVKAAAHDIVTGLRASAGGELPGWAASIIKLPVLVAAARDIEEGRLRLDSRLTVDHRFTLDPTDHVSRLPAGAQVPVGELLLRMIVDSDNEATNILGNHVGIDRINEVMWKLGMRQTMLGHLLCRGVPRHASGFNPDGSNITCPDDMVAVMRHVYDDAFSALTRGERSLCRQVMERTRASYLAAGPIDARRIREKRGYIRDPEAGSDIHAVGIVDDRLIVCIMLNKVGRSGAGGDPTAAFRRIMTVLAPCLDRGPASPKTDCAG